MTFLGLSSSVLLVNAETTDANKVTIKQKPAQLHIPYSKLSVEIDGELNDEIWQHASVIDLDIVNYPWNNKKSPVKTTAKIVENGEYLYVAFIANDPNPEEIKGTLGDRDNRWADDLVGIQLDTYNSRRLNYEFFVNSFGVQHDSIKNVMTGTANSSWDGIWDSYGKKTAQGFQVEIAIPYRILNFSESDELKIWAIELIRTYPRDTALRISHIPLNRDNDCWLCQAPELVGFKNAKAGKSIMVTPAVVASQNDTRDVYDNSAWDSKEDIEAGIDLRWGINSNTLLNATINPDFSTVESDTGQLSINKTFSLYYEEKRPFFLENSDYFSSDYNLVYTRNIADPDYGAKLTGTKANHSYGIFATNDTQTNFILPGNTGSSIVSLNEESHSAALKYRYDATEDLSFGAISTLRTSDNYHNYVVGFDSNYRINESNSIKGQIVSSNTEHSTASNPDDFSDQAFKLTYKHDSEYWEVTAEHQSIGKEFRADLGFMPRADINTNKLLVNRLFYGDEQSFWQEAKIAGQYQTKHSKKGELLERSFASSFGIDGPLLSYFDVMLTHAEKVGLRHDSANNAIENNTTLFTEDQITLYGRVQPITNLHSSLSFTYGDKIDYASNRLGDYQELASTITYNVNDHLELDLYLTHGKLDADGKNVYVADLAELRISYQFDVYSYLKLNLVYSDIDINTAENERELSTQLIYAYKLNPQTVFFLGYSDASEQYAPLTSLARKEKTFFTKISYAWMP